MNYLQVVVQDGYIRLADNNGDIIDGVQSVSVDASVKELTTVTATFIVGADGMVKHVNLSADMEYGK